METRGNGEKKRKRSSCTSFRFRTGAAAMSSLIRESRRTNPRPCLTTMYEFQFYKIVFQGKGKREERNEKKKRFKVKLGETHVNGRDRGVSKDIPDIVNFQVTGRRLWRRPRRQHDLACHLFEHTSLFQFSSFEFKIKMYPRFSRVSYPVRTNFTPTSHLNKSQYFLRTKLKIHSKTSPTFFHALTCRFYQQHTLFINLLVYFDQLDRN